MKTFFAHKGFVTREQRQIAATIEPQYAELLYLRPIAL